MSLVNILDVQILDNPAPFANPFQFEITFECISSLDEDLEWRIIYVGSAESEQYDQVLDNIMVGPVPVGVNKFVFQAPSPSLDKIPSSDALGVTVVLLTCSYMSREFVRIGYYVNNEYDTQELTDAPPAEVQWQRVVRYILSDKPRVTRFPIQWTKEAPELELPQVEGNPDEEPAELELNDGTGSDQEMDVESEGQEDAPIVEEDLNLEEDIGDDSEMSQSDEDEDEDEEMDEPITEPVDVAVEPMTV